MRHVQGLLLGLTAVCCRMKVRTLPLVLGHGEGGWGM